MAAYSQTALETSYSALIALTGLSKPQLAVIESAYYQILQRTNGPGATSAVILDGAQGA